MLYFEVFEHNIIIHRKIFIICIQELILIHYRYNICITIRNSKFKISIFYMFKTYLLF